jgi:hypothetical protein
MVSVRVANNFKEMKLLQLLERNNNNYKKQYFSMKKCSKKKKKNFTFFTKKAWKCFVKESKGLSKSAFAVFLPHQVFS